MSQPPSARPSPNGSPAVRPQTINLEGIYTNIPILINRVRNNQLATNQIAPLRNLISNHAKDIIIFHARLGRQNPLLNLPDLLNPTKKVNGYEATTTEAIFLGQVGQGVAAARSIRPDQALIAAMAAKQQAARAQVRPPGQAASPAGSPAPQPQQPAMSIQQVRELIALPTDERNRRLDADPALKSRFVAAYQFFQRRSAQAKQATPGPAVRPPPAASAASAASSAPSSGPTPSASPAHTTPATPTVPSAPATPTVPNTTSTPARPLAPPSIPSIPTTPSLPGAPSAPAPTSAVPARVASPAPARPATPSAPNSRPGTPTIPSQSQQALQQQQQQQQQQHQQQQQNAHPHPQVNTVSAPHPPPVVVPQRPPSPPRPPPPPPEPEPQRRRRKLREYMAEQAPDLAVELGMDDLFSEVLDTLVETVARDSVRLAAHRNSGRVELKDVAFVLDQYHDIVVPGFNAQVPRRVHAESDSAKRARFVAPRAPRRDDK